MLSASELTAVVRDARFELTTDSIWDVPRQFDEWTAIVDDEQRIHWHMMTARKAL